MKRLVFILFGVIFSCLINAQIIKPVSWDIKVLNNETVELIAEIDSDWHINVSEINGEPCDNVYHCDTNILFVNKSNPITITYNACNNVMCTSPETIELDMYDVDCNEQKDNPMMACILICLFTTLLLIGVYNISK
jgi:hypothetical protein